MDWCHDDRTLDHDRTPPHHLLAPSISLDNQGGDLNPPTAARSTEVASSSGYEAASSSAHSGSCVTSTRRSSNWWPPGSTGRGRAMVITRSRRFSELIVWYSPGGVWSG